MTDGKNGAAEWLRGIIEEYEVNGDMGGCSAMAKMLGVYCEDVKTCRDCMSKVMEVIADRIDADRIDAERALPDGIEWPRFEDGGLVMIGDELEFEGKTMLVCDATFYADGWALWCDREDMSGRLYGKYGERVKRPAPEALDADGVPINVGDTVYCNGEDKQLMVSHIIDSTKVALFDGHFSYFRVKPSRLSHKRPDSWNRLLEDLDKGAVAAEGSAELYCCDYFGADDCEACPASEVPFLCGKASFKDVADRIRALRGEGE